MDKLETLLYEIGETKDTAHGERVVRGFRELFVEIWKAGHWREVGNGHSKFFIKGSAARKVFEDFTGIDLERDSNG